VSSIQISDLLTSVALHASAPRGARRRAQRSREPSIQHVEYYAKDRTPLAPGTVIIMRTLLTLTLVALMLPLLAAQQVSGTASRGLTAVEGILVGHHTLTERPTGCTAIIIEAGVVAGVDVRGGAPGTKETDLLDPVNSVQQVHGISLAGGSAFGLDAATGVMRYLEERNIGFDVRVAKVPIVPAAILIDLWVGTNPKIRPNADCGYTAAKSATSGPVAEGSVGAGAGATVGKWGGNKRSMKGGLGSASAQLPSGLIVAALVAVNAAGDVVDPATSRVVAGMRTEDGKGLADVRTLLRGAEFDRSEPEPGANTTIGVIATNARLTKAQATKVAQMAHDGFARAIVPSHTPGDGDTIFALATGRREAEANVSLIGALAADVMAEAIVRAVRQATSVAGIPAVRDLGPAK
jgi:L-aminopeptidase/D-esterase-like protein